MSVTAMHRACAAGDLAGVQAALDANPALATAAADGKSPLHVASSAAIVRLLVASGADPLVVDAHGRTPLLVAAESQSAECIAELAGVTGSSVAKAMAEGQAAHVAADRLGRGPAHWLGQRLLAGAIREASSAVAAAFSASPASTRDSLASRWVSMAPADLSAAVLGASACTAGGESPLHWSARAACASGTAALDFASVVRELGNLGVAAGLRTRDGACASGIVAAALRAAKASLADGAAAAPPASSSSEERIAALEAGYEALQVLEESQAGRAPRAGLPAPSGGASAAAAAAPVKVCPAPAAAVGGRRQAGSRPKRGRLGGIGRRATGASGVQVTLKPAEA